MTSAEMVKYLRARYRVLARAHPRHRISEADYLAANLPGMLLSPKWQRMRKRNPRGGKFDRCVAEVRGKARNPYALCKSALKKRARKRRRNPSRYRRAAHMFVLVATKGKDKLHYLGGRKFGKRGRPTLFPTAAAAIQLGHELKATYPVLRGFALSTVPA